MALAATFSSCTANLNAFSSTFNSKFLTPTNATAIHSHRLNYPYISRIRFQAKPTSFSPPNSYVDNNVRAQSTIIFNAIRNIFKTGTFMFMHAGPAPAAPLSPSLDPTLVLAGNFAPVDELPPTDCELVQGTLPSCLDGAYMRNGPNPQYLPRGRPYHLFNGDGMVHCVRISEGRATLCSRYVKTYKHNTEREAGFPIVPSLFSSFNGGLASFALTCAVYAARILTCQYNPAQGVGLANTSLCLIGNRLFALGELETPYALRLTSSTGDIQTLGRHDFDGKKLFTSMTAHPKVDPDTGETFAFRYNPVRRPFLTYFYFDANGIKQPDVPIFSMPNPSFIHDFAITKKYAIFSDIQLEINPMKTIFGKGAPVCSAPNKVPRIGIIPRYARDESGLKWFDAPAGFNPIHVINAWDDDDDDGNAIVMLATNMLSVEHFMERMNLVHGQVEKVRIDLTKGVVTRQPISTRNLDMAVINPAYMAKRNKYVYAAVANPMPKFSGVVKLDVEKECIVGSRMYGSKSECYGGEPLFVSKEPGNPEAAEDDGYLLSFVHNEKTGESSLWVMDAKSADLDVAAVVKLPRRVPYGFHGLFVREESIQLADKLLSSELSLKCQ